MHSYPTIHGYSIFAERSIKFLGNMLTSVSKPGFPNWNEVTSASKLIGEHVTLPTGSQVLYMNSGNGIGGVYLAKKFPDSSLHMMDTNVVALESIEKTIAANSLPNIHVIPWSAKGLPDSDYDVVILEIIKGRKITRRFILEAFSALRIGGNFYLAGGNQLGIHSLIGDARNVFGNASLQGYKKGHRICLYEKATSGISHTEWSSEPGITPGSWYEFHTLMSNSPVTIRSIPGVFSYDKIDPGTWLLLQNLRIQPGQRVLDLGCGWGCIGIDASLKGAQVEMVDVDLLAYYSADQNIRSANLKTASVYASDITSRIPNRTYQIVLSNPPFHAGAQVDYTVAEAIVSQAYNVVESGGEIWLTANQFLTYQDYLTKYFGNSNIVAVTRGYKILRAIKV